MEQRQSKTSSSVTWLLAYQCHLPLPLDPPMALTSGSNSDRIALASGEPKDYSELSTSSSPSRKRRGRGLDVSPVAVTAAEAPIDGGGRGEGTKRAPISSLAAE